MMEKEKQISALHRWCPCTVCNKKETCKSVCLRFSAYVATENTRNRYKQFMRFAAAKNGAI